MTTATGTAIPKTTNASEMVKKCKINSSLKALKKLMKKSEKGKKSGESKELLMEESNTLSKQLTLVFGLEKMSETCSVKPTVIQIKHSIFNYVKGERGSLEVCLFVKDPQREYKDLIHSLGLDHVITKVIGISKLRQKYKEYEAKRLLCNSYDLFLADDRVLPLLPKLLGKTFFAKKRLPVPVSLKKSSTNLKSQVESLLCNGAILNANKGTCWSLKLGSLSTSNSDDVDDKSGGLSVEQVAENVEAAILNAVEKIPGRWGNVLGIHVKTDESIALPLYTRMPAHPLDQDMQDDQKVSVEITASAE